MRKRSFLQESLRSAVRIAVCVALLVFCSSCGYAWRSSQNPWAAKDVRKVYIKAMANNTLRPGAEVPFIGALTKEFARGQRIKVVSNPDDADAVIESTLDSVGSMVGPTTTLTQTTKDPAAGALNDYLVASEYTAFAGISVSLIRNSDRAALWSRTFAHPGKAYPANNRFGLVGTTSSLINASQEKLALIEIAQVLASDVYDTMFEAF